MGLQFEIFDNKKSNKAKTEIKKQHEPNKIIEDKINYLQKLIELEQDTELCTWYGTFTEKQEVEKGINGENYYITIHGATYIEAKKYMLKKYQTKFKQVLKHNEMEFKNKIEYLCININKQQNINLIWLV